MSVEARLAAEARRVYRRYALEIVEALDFCPYAERARKEGRTREVPMLHPSPTDDTVLSQVEAIAADPDVEIGLVLLPRLVMSRRRLGHWVERLRKAHAAAHHGRPVLAIEGFHPAAAADLLSAERLTPFVRRTPDPTLQLTRLDVLERVRRGTPQGTAFFDPGTMSLEALVHEAPRTPIHDLIAERNHATVKRLGVGAVARRIEDILRDRDAAYRAIDPDVPRRCSG